MGIDFFQFHNLEIVSFYFLKGENVKISLVKKWLFQH